MWGGVVGYFVGVILIKDFYYFVNGLIEEVLKDIVEVGYKGFEMFDGNLMEFKDRKEEFRVLLNCYFLDFIGVYIGGNFIFSDILEEELLKIEEVVVFVFELGVKYLVIGGGVICVNGILESDYIDLGNVFNWVVVIVEKYNFILSYYLYLGINVEVSD